MALSLIVSARARLGVVVPAGCCLALAVLLAERQAPPAGLCASPSCGKPFVNVGRGAARRYCSATCGTRERVARHRGAHQGRSEIAAP